MSMLALGECQSWCPHMPPSACEALGMSQRNLRNARQLLSHRRARLSAYASAYKQNIHETPRRPAAKDQARLIL